MSSSAGGLTTARVHITVCRASNHLKPTNILWVLEVVVRFNTYTASENAIRGYFILFEGLNLLATLLWVSNMSMLLHCVQNGCDHRHIPDRSQ